MFESEKELAARAMLFADMATYMINNSWATVGDAHDFVRDKSRSGKQEIIKQFTAGVKKGDFPLLKVRRGIVEIISGGEG